MFGYHVLIVFAFKKINLKKINGSFQIINLNCIYRKPRSYKKKMYDKPTKMIFTKTLLQKNENHQKLNSKIDQHFLITAHFLIIHGY